MRNKQVKQMILDVSINRIKSKHKDAEITYAKFSKMPCITYYANDVEPCPPRYSNGRRGVVRILANKA